MSDGFPVFGFHRRSYIFLAGAVGVVGFVGMGVIGGDLADPSLVTFFLFLTTLSIAFCDVCTDALVAANAKLESEAGAGNLQSLCWASLGFGGMVISLLAGPLYEALDAQICFFLSALIPAGRMFLAWRLKEPPAKKFDPEIIRGQTRKIIKTLCHPGVHRPIIYAFLSWATIPKLSDGQFNFFTVRAAKPRSCPAFFRQLSDDCAGHGQLALVRGASRRLAGMDDELLAPRTNGEDRLRMVHAQRSGLRRRVGRSSR